MNHDSPRPGTFPLGRIAGIPVRLHWSLALIAALFVVSLSAGLGWAGGVLAMLLFFASILAHEFGHALVARRHGVATTSVELWALGGVATLDRDAPSPRAEGMIAAAGPAVSVVLGAGFLGVAIATQSNVFAWLGVVNLALALFNLLPGAPLDGGRIVRAVRWRMTGDRYRASRDAGNAGRVLGWSLAIIGVAIMFNGGPGLFLAITGAFIAMSARAEIMASYVTERLEGVKVRDLTWFGVAHASTDTDADSMIWQRQRIGGAGAVAVAGPAGDLDGLVLEDQLWAVPPERRGAVLLRQLMVPFNRLAKAGPDEDLASVLPRLNPLNPVVTVWNGDRLLGVVPAERMRERLKMP